MLKITNIAIDRALERRLHSSLEDLAKSITNQIKKVAEEKPMLFALIQSGVEISKGGFDEDGALGERFKYFRAGYQSGAYLTLEMIEEQARIEHVMLPEINAQDVNEVGKEAEYFLREYGVKEAKMKKLKRIKNTSPDFGDYVLNYVMNPTIDEMTASGFAIGVITTFTSFEQAYKREASNGLLNLKNRQSQNGV